MADPYQPKAEHRFTFGLWTVGNAAATRSASPCARDHARRTICDLLGEVGAYGVNFHDNDLVPIDASPAERDRDRERLQGGARRTTAWSSRWRRRTCSAIRSSRTARSPSNNARVRAYAIQKTMRAMDLGAEFGAKIYVFWGGREGAETDATKNPVDAIKRFREAINSSRVLDRPEVRPASRSRPSPTSRAATCICRSPAATSGFIPTLDHPEMCGVNPEVAHEHMAGLNFVHHVAQALEREAVPHRPERPGVRPLRPGLPLRPQTSSTRSSW